jgi:hypothetical protein
VRDLHTITIRRGVTHVIAPKDEQQQLRLSDAELPLGDGVGEILAAQVDAGLHDSQARAAVFVDRRADSACGTFDRLFGARPRLVDLSKTIARRLYAVAETDNRISDGTVAVLQCQGVNPVGASVQFTSVLKLDPSATLHTITDTEPETGLARVRYVVDPTSLPSKNERIQKCVFVRGVGEDLEYEMLVVDRQRRGEAVSQFWVTEFLGAELALDGPERTKRTYRALRVGRNAVEGDLDATQLAALDQVIEGAVVQAHINLDDLVPSLPIPAEQQARIDLELNRLLPDREFDLDPGTAQQFIRRRSFVADNGLRLSINSDAYSMIHVEDLDGGPDDTRLRRISFETRTWKES